MSVQKCSQLKEKHSYTQNKTIMKIGKLTHPITKQIKFNFSFVIEKMRDIT
jgi:hypothetical protein